MSKIVLRTHPWLCISFSLIVGLGTLALILAPVAADGPSWQPVPAQPSDLTFHDLELELKAQKCLSGQLLSKGESVGISVNDRVATIWGSVDSLDKAKTIEQSVRSLIGVRSVTNQITVKRSERSGELVVQAPFRERTSPAENSSSDRQGDRESLVLRPRSEQPLATRESMWRPATRLHEPGIEGGVDKVPNSIVHSIPGGRDGATPKDRLSGSNGVRTQSLLTGRQDESAIPSAGRKLTDEVERIRLLDPDCGGLVAEVKQGVVTLRGLVSQWESAYRLAREIARLPKVERVVLQDVRIR